MNNDEILADFRRRYENTFVQVYSESKGIKVLGLVRKVSSDADKFATLDIETKEYGRIQTNFGSDEYQIKFEQPQPGVFQCGIDAQFLFRRADKQYTRGLCSANHTLHPVSRDVTGGVGAVSLSLDSIQKAFDHKTYPINVAMDMMENKKARSVALAHDFAVSLPMSPKGNHFVWHQTTLVGACDSKGKLTHLYETVFKEALQGVLNG